MTDDQNKNSWQTSAENRETDANDPIAGAPSVPPPPLEVKIRTMESDLESMAKSGGGGMIPRGESVRAPAVMSAEDAARELKRKSNAVWKIATPIFLVILLGILAFTLYNSFFAGGPKPPAPAASSGGETRDNVPGAAESLAVPSSAPLGRIFVHRSFFRKPADETLNFFVKGAAASASDLKTFSQKITETLEATSPDHNFFELDIKSADGRDLNVAEVLSAADASVLEPQFLDGHFNYDITFFAFRDKRGIWPGYALEFKPAENWLFLKTDVAKLEKSSKLENLFLSSPGAPAAEGFKDGIIGNQPVRMLKFGNTGAAFVYGRLLANYLIVSTSEEGFGKAVALLE